MCRGNARWKRKTWFRVLQGERRGKKKKHKQKDVKVVATPVLFLRMIMMAKQAYFGLSLGLGTHTM